MNPVVEQIKSAIDMTDIFDKYGFTPDRTGFLSCPFHREKTASLRAYADGRKWKCFGCGRSGSVVDFVMELFGISFAQAIIRINTDFGLNLTGRRVDNRAVARMRRERAEKERELRQYRATYDAHCERYRDFFLTLKFAPKIKMGEFLSDELAQNLAYAQAQLEYLDYWFEQNPWR